MDVRDVATLVERALVADFSGHEAFLAAASDSYLDRPVSDAVREFFGECPADCNLGARESALSTARARDLLDWEPAHSWREAADEPVPTPALVER